jgi:beta-galactosidase
VLDGLHDYACIYLDRKPIGTLDRRLNQTSVEIPGSHKEQELAILVENMGRINYNVVLRKDSKGMTDHALLANKELTGWSIFSLPMDGREQLHYRRASCTGPCFFRTSLISPAVAEDTFLDTIPIQKGFIWVNGRPLGRAWNAGPQASLFLPGSWLKKDKNSIVIFDLHAKGMPALQTIDHALWVAGKNEAGKNESGKDKSGKGNPDKE